MFYNRGMARYFYKALKDQKEVVSGYIDAESSAEARNKVKQLGFLPTGIYEEKPEDNAGLTSSAEQAKLKLKLSEKILFTSEMQTLLSSGISALEALESVAKYSSSRRISLVAVDISESIKSGLTFSEALKKYSNVFGNIYIAICIAGESAGFLPEALGYLLTLLKKQDTLKGKFIQMSIYPSILVTILVGVFFLMGGLVFPKLISGLNITDPPLTVSILTGSVSFILHYWFLILIFVVGLCYFINSIFGFDHIKKAYSDFLMKIPFLSDCIKYFSLAHYMSVMHIAYEAGIPITESLKMAESTISNDDMRKRAKDVANLISQGKSLTDAYYQSQLIPGVLMPLIATGEKTGKLGQMFRDASIGIEKKLDLALDALARAFEPLLMVVLGGCVGYFVIAFVQMYSEAMSSLLNLF